MSTVLSYNLYFKELFLSLHNHHSKIDGVFKE